MGYFPVSEEGVLTTGDSELYDLAIAVLALLWNAISLYSANQRCYEPFFSLVLETILPGFLNQFCLCPSTSWPDLIPTECKQSSNEVSDVAFCMGWSLTSQQPLSASTHTHMLRVMMGVLAWRQGDRANLTCADFQALRWHILFCFLFFFRENYCMTLGRKSVSFAIIGGEP